METEASSSSQKSQHRPIGSEKRSKSVQACDNCKKKKVKCDGERPSCKRCLHRNIDCTYTTKLTTRSLVSDSASLQHRLQLVERAIATLDLSPPPLDRSTVPPLHSTNPSQFLDKYDVHIHGQPFYVQDWATRRDRLPAGPFQQMTSLEPERRKPEALSRPAIPIRQDLLTYYIQHVHHYFPVLHLATLHQRLWSQQSDILLLNAVYAVAEQWQYLADASLSRASDATPPGWEYYLQALSYLELYLDAPRLSTIQAMLLLIRYQDLQQRTGYLWRSRSFMPMVVQMCHDLSLHRSLPDACSAPALLIEQRNRVFWIAFIYDVLIHTEAGVPFKFDVKECTADLPRALPDEADADHQQALLYFQWMTTQMKFQARILNHLRAKQPIPALLQSEHHQFGAHIYSPHQILTARFGFLFMAHRFNAILMLRPLLKKDPLGSRNSPTDDDDTPRNAALKAADSILSTARFLPQQGGIDCLHYGFRGIQQVIHYITAARTMYVQCGQPVKEHEAFLLLSQLVPHSPMNELNTIPLQHDIPMPSARASPPHPSPVSPSSTPQPQPVSPIHRPASTPLGPDPLLTSRNFRTYPPAFPAHHLPSSALSRPDPIHIAIPIPPDPSLPSHRTTLARDEFPPAVTDVPITTTPTEFTYTVDTSQDIPSRHLSEQDPSFWQHDSFFHTSLPPS
ncbi:hypothetical protein DM01DRAFT_1382031 [Hesseltinella vesiculosa]|uniref:Zn(2)-C6 fungal-type domain-containing protein n=1 Tax=Hesseltinella vesiculosa TaxID=101127 RepID=A0A1X2GN40_9FUNG|nr:hypothetical protein DM01DRAFT_1382031 [Hesseltinella vesiculosa]